MNIILMGYRGSGKTTVGKRLAAKLWKEFVDVDEKVRDRFDGLTIAEIWDKHGEPAFREAEVEVTRELLQLDDHVIALGGGTVMQPEARAVVQAAENCKRVYLYASPTVLMQRIEADAASLTSRPSLTGEANSVEEVEQVLEERDPIYRDIADVTFNCSFTDISDTVRFVIDRCM